MRVFGHFGLLGARNVVRRIGGKCFREWRGNEGCCALVYVMQHTMKVSIHILYVYYMLYMCFFVLLTYIFCVLNISFEYYERWWSFF